MFCYCNNFKDYSKWKKLRKLESKAFESKTRNQK